MPVQSNIAIGTTGTVAWDGSSAYGHDIRKHNRFAWSFEVTGVIAADAVFNVQAAPASDGDPCVAGNYAAVPEIAECSGAATPGPQATITIPAGTPVGTVCGGTIPCRPGAFVQLASASGTTENVKAVLLRQGPRI